MVIFCQQEKNPTIPWHFLSFSSKLLDTAGFGLAHCKGAGFGGKDFCCFRSIWEEMKHRFCQRLAGLGEQRLWKGTHFGNLVAGLLQFGLAIH